MIKSNQIAGFFYLKDLADIYNRKRKTPGELALTFQHLTLFNLIRAVIIFRGRGGGLCLSWGGDITPTGTCHSFPGTTSLFSWGYVTLVWFMSVLSLGQVTHVPATSHSCPCDKSLLSQGMSLLFTGNVTPVHRECHSCPQGNVTPVLGNVTPVLGHVTPSPRNYSWAMLYTLNE